MRKKIELSVIIVNYNTKELLENCIDSVISGLTDVGYEILVVDNASNDGSVNYLKGLSEKNKNVKCYFMSENLGFGAGNNYAMKKSSGKYLLLLNSDTVIENDVIKKLLLWMEKNSDYGVVSPNLYNKDSTIQGTGGYFPTLPRVFSWMTIQDLPFVDNLIKPFHPMKSRSFATGEKFYANEHDLDWLTGAFLLMRRKVYEDVGGFDESFFMYTEEVEYFIRIKIGGWRVKYLPLPGVIHLGGASGEVGFPVLKEFEGIKKLYSKHYSSWQYPVLKMLLRLGCILRIVAFWIIKDPAAIKIYAKAYKTI